jgi:hypothetical protein
MCSYIAFHWPISNVDVKNEWSYTSFLLSPISSWRVHGKVYGLLYVS